MPAKPVEDAATVTKAVRGAVWASGACMSELLGHSRQPQLQATAGPPHAGWSEPVCWCGERSPPPQEKAPEFQLLVQVPLLLACCGLDRPPSWPGAAQ